MIKIIINEGDAMVKKNKITVNIYGQNYTIVSEESEEFILKVSAYVDEKMRNFAKHNSLLSYQRIAVLTALNIADEYHKVLDQIGLDTVGMTSEDYLNTKEKIENLNLELERSSSQYENMSKQFEQLIDNSANYEIELEDMKRKMQKMKEKLRLLSYELDDKEKEIVKKEEKLADLEKTIERMRNKMGTNENE